MKQIMTTAYTLLFTTFFLLVGCESTKDPLAGWKEVSPIGYSSSYSDATIFTLAGYKAITDDVQTFVRTLPEDRHQYYPGYQFQPVTVRSWCYYIHRITLFESSNGQHAVKIEIPVNGVVHNYVLIYNKENVRIRKTRFANGWYRC
jgi:hypothetical protein